MSATARRITVTIDELVLDGFDRRDRDRIADAIRAELTAAVGDWAPPAGASLTHLDAGSFTVLPDAAPGLVGRGIAQRISGALPAQGARVRAARQDLTAAEGSA